MSSDDAWDDGSLDDQWAGHVCTDMLEALVVVPEYFYLPLMHDEGRVILTCPRI